MDIWIVVIVFIIIAGIAAVLLWRFWPDIIRTSFSGGTSTSTSAGFLEPCSNVVICETGLACDANTCKRNIGQPCSTVSDCVTAATACTGGVCIEGETGGLNQPAPCNQGLVPNNQNICKGEEMFSCSTNSDCISNVCNGTCQLPKNLGETCSSGQCNIGLHCSSGFCQTDGITTGQSGAFCGTSGSRPTCNQGSVCSNNVCMSSSQGFTDECSDTTLCFEPMICSGSICRFPAPNNACSPNLQCSEGMTCVSNTCKSNLGLTCISSSDCHEGSCDGFSLFRTSFSEPGWVKQIDLPESVRFSRIEARISEIWGLSVTSNTELSGLYSWAPGQSSWTRAHDGQHRGTIIDFALGTNGSLLTLSRDGPTSVISEAVRHQDGSISLAPWNTMSGVQIGMADLPIENITQIDMNEDNTLQAIAVVHGGFISTGLVGSSSLDLIATDVDESKPVRLYSVQGSQVLFNVMFVISGTSDFSFMGAAEGATVAPGGNIASASIFSRQNAGFQDTIVWVVTSGPNGAHSIIGGEEYKIPGYFGSTSAITATFDSPTQKDSFAYAVSGKCSENS